MLTGNDGEQKRTPRVGTPAGPTVDSGTAVDLNQHTVLSWKSATAVDDNPVVDYIDCHVE